MAAPKIDIVIRAKDEASRELQGIEGRLGGMRDQLRMAAVAMAAFGAAGLKVIGDAKKMNAQLALTARGLGVTKESLRDLALEAANVTFPLEEVIASFDLLTRAGIRNTEVLEATATAFDMLGDATGYSASQVTEIMIPAMKTFGLTAEEVAGKVDLMTYMSRESTMSLEDFGTMVGYTTPQLVKAGLTIEDLTIALIHMEKEGYAPGRVMTREFMKATTLATKEQIPLTEALGITTKELEGYREELETASGMTEEYAELANEQYGLIDKLKHGFSELTLKLGSTLEPLEGIFAAMTALSPVILLLSTRTGAHVAALMAHRIATVASTLAIKAATVAQWLWNAAIAANPFMLLIMGIIAIISWVYKLLGSWERFIEFWQWMWDEIVDDLKTAWNAIVDFFGWVWEKIMDGWNKIVDFFKWIGEEIKKIFMRIGEAMYAPIKWAVDKSIEYINLLIRAINLIPGVSIGEIGWRMPEFPSYQRGIASVPETGLAMVHRGETILRAGAKITIPIYLGDELIMEKIVELAGDRARLEGY